jgi:uncharacterized protein YoxC
MLSNDTVSNTNEKSNALNDSGIENDFDDSDSSSETSSGTNTEDSLQLSLPASFGAASINLGTSPTAAEVKLLRAQILESRALVKNLVSQQSNALQSLSSKSLISQEEYNSIQCKPRKSFEESLSILVFDQVAGKMNELNITQMKLAEASEMLQKQEKHATSLADELANEKERREGMEHQVDRLQQMIIDLQEKGRLCEELEAQKINLDIEIKRLRNMLDQQGATLNKAIASSEDEKDKIITLKQKLESKELDKSFLEKEKRLLEDRAVRAEDARKKSDQTIRDLELKIDELTLELAESKAKLSENRRDFSANDTEGIREEFMKEMASHRQSMETIHAREINTLIEAKHELTKRCERSEEEVERLRTNLTNLTSEKDRHIIDLERSLADCRSDLKVKCIETARMGSTVESLEEELKQSNRKIELLSDQVEAHKAAFSHLEQESMFEHKRLVDEISRKDEQLEMYYQTVVPNGKGGETHLLDKSRSLTKRCEELQKKVAYLQGQLKKESERCALYESKVSEFNEMIRNVMTRNGKSDSDQKIQVIKDLLEQTDFLKANEQFLNLNSQSCVKVGKNHFVWNVRSTCTNARRSGLSDLSKHTTHHASQFTKRTI